MASENKQLSINLIASIATYFVQYAISLVLTPYIVKELGVAAYGFVGLSTQIIGYSSLITIALNSMAGRFISIEYYKGNIEKANMYFSSVFYGNLIIGAVLFVISCFMVIFLDLIINIPPDLVVDVKMLFAFLAINAILGILANVYSVSTFIKNRLDYANIRNIIGNIIRAVVLVVCFSLFAPKVWYFGFTGIICTIYIFVTNYKFAKRLTPDLQICKKKYDLHCVKELIVSGSWNVLTKLSAILEYGLNLLIANLFIGPVLAGTLALSMTIPTMIHSVCGMMASNFAPTWTHLYTNNDRNKMLNEILKSIRIMGFMSSIPLAVFLVLGDTFFSLWVPQENATELYWLAAIGSLVMLFAMPLETIWNVFTITNQVKKSSINLFEYSILTIVIVLLGMYIVEDNVVRLFIIASTRSVVSSIRTLTFLPIQGAKCLGYSLTTFYPPVFRNLFCVILIFLISLTFKTIISSTWSGLILGCLCTCIIGIIVNVLFTLTKVDREYLFDKLCGYRKYM